MQKYYTLIIDMLGKLINENLKSIIPVKCDKYFFISRIKSPKIFIFIFHYPLTFVQVTDINILKQYF